MAVTARGTAAAPAELSPKERRVRAKRRAQWVGLIAALLVVVFGVLLLWGVWYGSPVAAPFTRVGGQTNVETAVDASHFWLTPPKFVVKTPATASQSMMLGAAQCAMDLRAPLLFTSQNNMRQQLVTETINAWHLRPKHIIMYTNLNQCLNSARAHPLTDIDGLSTLAVPYPLVAFPKGQPKIPAQKKLAPTVVFAAALGPGFLPDIAVGMALAAHMASAQNPVSLVVVPRYLEADPKLEIQLEKQHQLISGGVVLGQTITVPDDTLALLRLLLTARNGHGALAQLQDNLGSVGPVVAAIVALIGLGAASRVGQQLYPVTVRIKPESPGPPPSPRWPPPPPWRWPGIRQLLRVGRVIMVFFSPGGRGGRLGGQQRALAGGYWQTALGETKNVTIWLRSGTKVAGTVENWYPDDKKQDKDRTGSVINVVLKLQDVTLTRQGSHEESATFEFMLVSVDDIELIAKVQPRPTAAA